MSKTTSNLKSSLSYSFFDKYVGYGLRFISTIIIARLLTPAEVGIFSVAFVLINLGHVLRDFGVAQYLIREKTLSQEKIRAALTVMWVIAWGLFFIIYLAKHQFAQLYNEPGLVQALEILTLIFLLAPFGSVRIALLRRNMQFKTLAKINIFSYVTSTFISLYLAYKGLGYMALVWGQFWGVVATLTGTVIACWKDYWYFPGLKGVKQVLKFGLNISMSNIAETASDGAPDLILGKIIDMAAVGFFSRALGCLNLFKVFVTSAVWPVILPYFSQKNRQGDNLTEDFSNAIAYYSVFAWPFFITLGICADLVIPLLYGPQWEFSVPLLQVLCLWAAAEALFPFRNALLVAIGEIKLNLKLQVSISCLRIIAVLTGAFYGLLYTCYALVVAECIAVIMQYIALHRVLNFNFKYLFNKISASLMVTTAVVGVVFVLRGLTITNHLQLWSQAVCLVGISGLVWLLSVFFTKHPASLQVTAILNKLRT